MSGYTFPTSSIAEPFYNPYNPDYLSKAYRMKESGSLHAQFTVPTSSVLTVSESVYYYKNSDTK